MERRATVFVNRIAAATLFKHEKADSQRYELRYLPDYLTLPQATAISLRLPLRSEPYFSDCLFPIFDNMLPEGEYRRSICLRLRLDESDSFGLLLALAQYDSIGAVTVREDKQ